MKTTFKTSLLEGQQSWIHSQYVVVSVWWNELTNLLFTSNTAQVGGASFKNRKPIGEVGCCESRMAERSHWWIERWLMSPLFLSDYLPTYLPTYLSIYLSTYLYMYLFVCLSVYLSTCLSASLQTRLFCETSSYFKVDNIKNEANSARLPQCLNLATSKTKRFCETSSFFKVGNIKNEAILRDLLNVWTWQRQKWSYSASLPHFSKLTTSKTKNSARLPSRMESWVQSWWPRTAIFPVHLSKVYTAPATKKWCQVIQSAAPVSQNHLSKPEDLRLQNVTLLRKSAPGPPNSSDEDVSCTAPATENASLPHACHRFWKCYKTLTFCSLWQGPQSLAPASQNDIWTSKSGPDLVCFVHLTWKYSSRHSGVHFFNSSTSKSGPKLVCFLYSDFEMCLAPQRRALFWHLNFQKWSGPGVFCTFWLRNVLRATAACTFSTAQLPKVVRSWCSFYILTLKCAWRHNGVHIFDISTSTNMWCFVHFGLEMCFAPQRRAISSLIWPHGSAPAALASLLFDPPEPQIIGKTPCFATFLPFRAPASSFFWLFLFSDFLSSTLLSSTLLFSLTLPISAFHLSILSEVWLLNFLRSFFILHPTNGMMIPIDLWNFDGIETALQMMYVQPHWKLDG